MKLRRKCVNSGNTQNFVLFSEHIMLPEKNLRGPVVVTNIYSGQGQTMILLGSDRK